MGTYTVRTQNLGDAGRFSCTWTTTTSLLEEIIGAYLSPSPQPPPLACRAPPPRLMLPEMDVCKKGRMFCRFFNPFDQEFRIVRKHKSLPASARAITSSKGWVTFVHPRDGALYIWNPLSDVQKDVLRLPSVVTLPLIRNIRFAHRNGSPTTTVRDFTIYKEHKYRSAFDISSMLLTIVNGSFSTAPDDCSHCIAMRYYDLPPSLHYSEIGDNAWKALDSPLFEYAQVMASSKKDKLFFALNTIGEIEAWNLSDLSDIKRTPVTEAHRVFSFDPDESHLVREIDSNGQTYYKEEIDYMVESG